MRVLTSGSQLSRSREPGIVRQIVFGTLRIQRTATTTIASMSGLIVSGICDYRVLLLATAIFLFHSSAGVMNDVADYEVDRLNAPERPLVRGTISIKQAVLLGLSLMALALIVMWFLDFWLFLLSTSVGLAIEFLYNYGPRLKNDALGSFLYLSLSISPIPFLVGCFVARNLTNSMVILSLVLALWSTCITLGSFKDVEGDALLGKRTYVVTMGVEKAKRVVTLLILLSLPLYSVPPLVVSLSDFYIILAAALGLFRIMLACSILRDVSPRKARELVVWARGLIVADHVALVLASIHAPF